jgi:hypothetical protein
MRLPFIQIAATALLAASALALALCALMALEGGHGEVAAGGARLSIAAGYDRWAIALYLRPNRTSADLAAASQANHRAYELYPYNTGALVRMAQVQAVQDGRLDERSIQEIRRSYDLIAVDPRLAVWRIQFCLNNWAEMPSDLKTAVIKEYQTLSKEPTHGEKLLDMLKSVENPSGRLVAAFWMAGLAK